MRTVTRYEANDGSTWDTPELAEKQDQLIADVESALSHLKPRPDTCDFANGYGCAFANGYGFVQHIKGARELALSNMREVVARHLNDDYYLKCHSGFLLRVMSESGKVLNNAYYRIECICPDTDREFGQPYFVTHQHEVKVTP